MREAVAGHDPALLTAEQLPDWLRRHLPQTGSLTADSRIVRPGDAFFALRGARHDGAAYVRQAIEAGAAAIVFEAERDTGRKPAATPATGREAGGHTADGDGEAGAAMPGESVSVPCCQVPDLKVALGSVAAAWYGQPSRAFDLVAVTGTNGKTSVTHWVADGCNRVRADERAVVVGTNGEGVPGALRPIGMTTPDALTLQTLFRNYRDRGIEVVAMEASSIGLEQGRMTGSAIRTAVFTNLSRDHLDYHGSMEAYAESKQALFAWPGLEHAVVHLDEALAPTLLDTLARNPSRPRIIGYLVYDAWADGAENGAADGDSGAEMPPALQRAMELADACHEVLMAVAVEPGRWVLNLLQAPDAHLADEAEPLIDPSAVTDADLDELEQAPVAVEGDLQQSTIDLDLQLIGRFNLANALAVAGVWRAMGWSLDEIALRLAELRPVPGRMENITAPGANEAEQAVLPMVVVDYAHTPDALDNTLSALREVAARRGGALWCVFGAGGNRDAGKRPQMAAVAERLADRVVLTSDNPRDEDPARILQDVAAGLSGAAWRIEVDRRLAIGAAVDAAAPQDVVLVAGKGRESTQEIAGVFHPFSDPETVATALLARLDRERLPGETDV